MKNLKLLVAIGIIFSCQSNTKQKTIGIWPIGNINSNHIDSLKSALERMYSYRIVVLNKIPMPKSAFINVKTPRYRADSLIAILKRRKADSLDYVIGITVKDISTTKRTKNGEIKKPASKYADWGVFGLGYRPGTACILSTHRLTGPNKKRNIERIQKIGIHEIGHNLGLKHCSNTNCVMQDAAESIRTIDQVAGNLCNDCKEAL